MAVALFVMPTMVYIVHLENEKRPWVCQTVGSCKVRDTTTATDKTHPGERSRLTATASRMSDGTEWHSGRFFYIRGRHRQPQNTAELTFDQSVSRSSPDSGAIIYTGCIVVFLLDIEVCLTYNARWGFSSRQSAAISEIVRRCWLRVASHIRIVLWQYIPYYQQSPRPGRPLPVTSPFTGTVGGTRPSYTSRFRQINEPCFYFFELCIIYCIIWTNKDEMR